MKEALAGGRSTINEGTSTGINNFLTEILESYSAS
jgi:hypothetical protein